MAPKVKEININSASAEELAHLEGIGHTRAQEIINYRNQHGPFQTIDDLKKVPGISDELLRLVRESGGRI